MLQPRPPTPLGLLALCLCPLIGCSDDAPPPASGTEGTTSSTTTDDPPPAVDSTTAGIPDPGIPIVPGVGIGDLMIGDRGDRLMMLAGEPDSTFRFGNVALLTFDAPALEVLLAAPEGQELTATSKVLSVGALLSDDVEFSGPAVPGQRQNAILDESGPPTESIDDADFYDTGWSVVYTASGFAKSVTVFPPYTLAADPPAMTPISE
ncbi:MAG: hypothetical protein AAGF11_54775 [Myxococcota bacterium]